MTVDEPEDIRAFGFSPDGDVFVVGSSPNLVIFRKDNATADA